MAILSALLKHDVMLACDLARLANVRKKRGQMAKKYFLRNAAQWDALRL
ncbi:hypothetical protein HNQ69_000274 [Bartonella callosciuri]|uniref:Uncharacterized protein n=1 Tax=Bartonella callosciuri TaxID=686223 RepID=A0A840NMR8_9HYPH|nr:hypothetical protein [Bartonella callosciuri]